MRGRDRSGGGSSEGGGAEAAGGSPGKRTLTAGLVRARRAAGAGEPAATATVDDAGGAPLPAGPRAQFERSLGADLSSVRVHTGESSAQAASDLGALAFTAGDDIHFAAGHYRPDDGAGQHLLAHEVAHTVQQRGGAPTHQEKLEVSSPGDASELEADRAADAMVRGAPAAVSPVGARLARQPRHGGHGHHRAPPAAAVPAAPAAAGPDPVDPSAPPAPAQAGPSPHPPLTASMFLPVTGQPVIGGGVEVHVPAREAPGMSAAIARDHAAVSAPEITFDADVGLAAASSLQADDHVYVGAVQTITSTERVAVYRDGGPSGAVLAEQRIAEAFIRDATATIHTREPGHPLTIDAPAPFYSLPSLADLHNEPGSTRRHLHFADRPELYAPRHVLNTGVLTETRGSEHFSTVIAAKRPAEADVLQLRAFEWSVPWTARIPVEDGEARGGQVGVRNQTPGQAPMPPDDTTMHDVQQARRYWRYPTVEAAMQAPTADLLRQHFLAMVNEPEQAALIGQALFRRDLVARCSISLRRGASWLTAHDDVQITARGHGVIVRSTTLTPPPRGQPMLAEGYQLDIRLNDVITWPDCTTASKIWIEAQAESAPLQRFHWDFPLVQEVGHDSYTMSPGGEGPGTFDIGVFSVGR